MCGRKRSGLIQNVNLRFSDRTEGNHVQPHEGGSSGHNQTVHFLIISLSITPALT